MPRIGVSIDVPGPGGPRLQAYRVSLGDEAARHIPTHVTLLPPYEADEAEVARITGHLDDVAAAHPTFRIHLRGTGTFRPVSPVVFLNVVEGIGHCEQMAAGVRRGPLAVETEFPYHPHVTVAHHLDDTTLDRAFAELADFECSFEVDRVWMYVHDPEDGWLPTRSFALRGGLGECTAGGPER